MAQEVNLFDPLGIFGKVKEQVDQMSAKTGLPPLPGPPGFGRRTDAERAVRHTSFYGEGPLPPRGEGYKRLVDPLGLFIKR